MRKWIVLCMMLLLFGMVFGQSLFIKKVSGEMLEFELDQIQDIAFSGEVSIEEIAILASSMSINLMSNYPNPFNPITTISFEISKQGYTKVDIFNARGTLVESLLNKVLNNGKYDIKWNGKDFNGNQVSSGLYFYRVSQDGLQQTKRMILLK